QNGSVKYTNVWVLNSSGMINTEPANSNPQCFLFLLKRMNFQQFFRVVKSFLISYFCPNPFDCFRIDNRRFITKRIPDIGQYCPISSSFNNPPNGVIGTCPGYSFPSTSIGPSNPLRVILINRSTEPFTHLVPFNGGNPEASSPLPSS